MLHLICCHNKTLHSKNKFSYFLKFYDRYDQEKYEQYIFNVKQIYNFDNYGNIYPETDGGARGLPLGSINK